VLDSVSLVPLLNGKSSSVRGFNYADHFGSTRNGESNERAIYNGHYKLVQDFMNDKEELYSIKNDPYEHEDLLMVELSSDAKSNYDALKVRIETLTNSK
jgi:Icc-related predicted phosphoesterase